MKIKNKKKLDTAHGIRNEKRKHVVNFSWGLCGFLTSFCPASPCASKMQSPQSAGCSADQIAIPSAVLFFGFRRFRIPSAFGFDERRPRFSRGGGSHHRRTFLYYCHFSSFLRRRRTRRRFFRCLKRKENFLKLFFCGISFDSETQRLGSSSISSFNISWLFKG